MADLPSSFWGGWVAVLTIVSLLGLAWLLYSIYFSKSESDEHGKVIWDETLNEGEHPAPMWWFWLILSTMVITVIYLMLYPGLGAFSGVMKWSQKGRIEESYAQYIEEYEDIRNTVFAMSLEELREDTASINAAQGIFERNCVMCHGDEAGGIEGAFPGLRNNVWQWGGALAQIEQTIRNGRRANMPGWSESLSSDEIEQVVQYLQVMGTENIADDNPGKIIYGQLCFGCHGIDGTGNINIGAPSLVDNIWLYGKSNTALTETLTHGRTGVMPAFQDRLNDVQIRLLIAWLNQ